MQLQLDISLLLLPILGLVGLAALFRILEVPNHQLRQRYRAYRFDRERSHRSRRTLGNIQNSFKRAGEATSQAIAKPFSPFTRTPQPKADDAASIGARTSEWPESVRSAVAEAAELAQRRREAEAGELAQRRRELEILVLESLHALETGDFGASRRLEAAQQALQLFDRHVADVSPIGPEESVFATPAGPFDTLTSTHSGSVKTVVLRPAFPSESSHGAEQIPAPKPGTRNLDHGLKNEEIGRG